MRQSAIVMTDSGFTSIVTGYDGIDVGSSCDYQVSSSLSDGNYWWRMKATDSVGNVGAYGSGQSIEIDTTAPSVSVESVSNDSSAPFWDNSDNSDTNMVLNAGESGTSSKWGASNVVFASLPNACSNAIPSATKAACDFGNITPQASGIARYYGVADYLNNATSTASVSFGVDWTVPTSSFDCNSSIKVPSYSVTLTEADNLSNTSQILSYYCTGAACTPTTSIDNGGSVQFTSSNRGVNTLRYYSVDEALNSQAIQSCSLNINQLPSFSAADANVGNANPTIKGGSGIKVTATASDVDAGQVLKFFVCKAADANWQGCGSGGAYCSDISSSSNSSCSWTSEFDNSQHNWYAYVFDSLNEASASNYRTGNYTNDDANATVTLQSPANSSTINNTKPNFIASASEAVSNCYLQVDDNSDFGSPIAGLNSVDVGGDCDYNGSEYSFTFLDGTTYYWRMRATDIVGNVGGYGSDFNFLVDTSGPSVSVVSVAGDSSAPYWDSVNDSTTTLVISGESGMTCRIGTTNVDYNLLAASSCTTNGTQASCDLDPNNNLTESSSITRYYACIDSLGNSTSTLSVTLGLDWTV
ncbi:MAG: hypothetical protein HZC29_01775, partial [Thaumarchaeota archaeon]|nr:hypothetical protein [Nitrososphaerota archaeon]